MTLRFAGVLLASFLCAGARAQPSAANYDESKVPKYTLPDPLVLRNGERVRDVDTWQKRRRPEILAMFETQMFGRSPSRYPKPAYELASIDKQALAGKAVSKQVTVSFNSKKDGPKMHMLIYLPAGARKPVPVFLGLNFGGNHSVAADPGIRLEEVWVRDRTRNTLTRQAGAGQPRGSGSESWQVDKILARGYGLATICYNDIEPDFDGGIGYGVRPLFLKTGQAAPAAEEWGAIGAWAWGLSRAMDYLETDAAVDSKRVAVIGHSRLGKTAIWAGAQDQRFAMVIPVNSGEGGVAISRRMFGENVRDLNTRFPHWFCANYRSFSERVNEMPFDQHMLVALVAPRPVYVASAEQDRWADPRGEFLAALHAGPVYHLYGKKGLETEQMPAIHKPIMNTVGYHIRAGQHAVTAYDWDQFLDFADKHFGR